MAKRRGISNTPAADAGETSANVIKRRRQGKTQDDAANEPEGEQLENSEKQIKSLRFRCAPEHFSGLIARLNSKQRNSVREMGFGPLLRFSLTELPGTLAYWIVSNLHVAASSIKLNGNHGLHIDEDDVHVTLGFPKGSLPIKRKERLGDHPFADGIAYRVGKERNQLLDTDVENEM